MIKDKALGLQGKKGPTSQLSPVFQAFSLRHQTCKWVLLDIPALLNYSPSCESVKQKNHLMNAQIMIDSKVVNVLSYWVFECFVRQQYITETVTYDHSMIVKSEERILLGVKRLQFLTWMARQPTYNNQNKNTENEFFKVNFSFILHFHQTIFFKVSLC